MNRCISDREIKTMDLPGRSQGDGMECVANHDDSNKARNDLVFPVNKEFTKHKSLPINFNVPKEPKFVPYEPYKAAINLIVPKPRKSRHGHKPYRPLFSDVLEKADLLKLSPLLKKEDFDIVETDKPTESPWEQERLSMLKEMQQLREEKTNLESQLNIQLQVNNELKKLLVASVGEDMNDRIAFLTEDKVKLADVITYYDSNLRNNSEETESIAIESDVWRSKFLASSMIVKDLAVCKAVLTKRNDEFKDVITSLLDTQESLFDKMSSVLRGLKAMSVVFSTATVKKTGNSPKCLQTTISGICETLKEEVLKLGTLLLGSSSSVTMAVATDDSLYTKANSDVEDSALQLINAPLSTNTDLPFCSCHSKWWDEAVIQAQLRPDYTPNFNCCPNCEGEVIHV